jgi:hypothetical protein
LKKAKPQKKRLVPCLESRKIGFLKVNGKCGGTILLRRVKKEARGMQTIMNLPVTFKEDVVDHYTVIVFKESVPEQVLPLKEP